METTELTIRYGNETFKIPISKTTTLGEVKKEVGQRLAKDANQQRYRRGGVNVEDENQTIANIFKADEPVVLRLEVGSPGGHLEEASQGDGSNTESSGSVDQYFALESQSQSILRNENSQSAQSNYAAGSFADQGSVLKPASESVGNEIRPEKSLTAGNAELQKAPIFLPSGSCKASVNLILPKAERIAGIAAEDAEEVQIYINMWYMLVPIDDLYRLLMRHCSQSGFSKCRSPLHLHAVFHRHPEVFQSLKDIFNDPSVKLFEDEAEAISVFSLIDELIDSVKFEEQKEIARGAPSSALNRPNQYRPERVAANLPPVFSRKQTPSDLVKAVVGWSAEEFEHRLACRSALWGKSLDASLRALTGVGSSSEALARLTKSSLFTWPESLPKSTSN